MATMAQVDLSLLWDLLEVLGPLAVLSPVRDGAGSMVDLRYELANDAYCHVVDAPCDALRTRRLSDLHSLGPDAAFIRSCDEVVRTGRPLEVDLPAVGATAAVTVRVRRLHDGVVVHTDTTGTGVSDPSAAPARRGSAVPVPATPVEVWCRSTRRWVPGYHLDAIDPDGRVRVRRPDGSPVPAAFDRVEVRPSIVVAAG